MSPSGSGWSGRLPTERPAGLDAAPRIERVAERLVYENGFIRLYNDEVQFPSGQRGSYVRVAHVGLGIPVVLIVESRDRFALVQTFRYPLGQLQWGFPRGFAHGEPLVTARAELREELGLEAAALTVVGHITPDSGLLSTRVAVVRAVVAEPSRHTTDPDEVLDIRWVSAEGLHELFRSGAIEDGFTLSAFMLAGCHQRD